LTNNAEVKTIAATSALYSILPDRMTGQSCSGFIEDRALVNKEAIRRFSI
jgi:hypothetical protein